MTRLDLEPNITVMTSASPKIDALSIDELQHAEGAALGRDAAIDQHAAIAYKKIADEVFQTECAIRTEIAAGERFHILEIPVANPDASHRENEDRTHSAIEEIAPEYVGRIVFQYVPRRGAA